MEVSQAYSRVSDETESSEIAGYRPQIRRGRSDVLLPLAELPSEGGPKAELQDPFHRAPSWMQCSCIVVQESTRWKNEDGARESSSSNAS